MPEPVKVRDAIPRDVETIVQFNCAMAAESEKKQLDPRLAREGVEAAFASPALCRYFVAELGGRVVGQTMITYEWSDWRAGVFWWIQSVYVLPDCRGRGVFRALYEHIASLARRQAGVCGLRLYVDRGNRPAMEVYERLGLRPTGHLLYEVDWSAQAS